MSALARAPPADAPTCIISGTATEVSPSTEPGAPLRRDERRRAPRQWRQLAGVRSAEWCSEGAQGPAPNVEEFLHRAERRVRRAFLIEVSLDDGVSKRVGERIGQQAGESLGNAGCRRRSGNSCGPARLSGEMDRRDFEP